MDAGLTAFLDQAGCALAESVPELDLADDTVRRAVRAVLRDLIAWVDDAGDEHATGDDVCDAIITFAGTWGAAIGDNELLHALFDPEPAR